MSLIQILTKDEEKIFELPPTFDSFAKNHFFKLTSGISEIILEMKNDGHLYIKVPNATCDLKVA